MKYRMYVDEVGNSDMGASTSNPNHRYLSLTSRQLKVKRKSNNIVGLQIADLIAHPSYRATCERRNGGELPANFGGQIAQILEETKYHRDLWGNIDGGNIDGGNIDGWGRKWLP